MVLDGVGPAEIEVVPGVCAADAAGADAVTGYNEVHVTARHADSFCQYVSPIKSPEPGNYTTNYFCAGDRSSRKK